MSEKFESILDLVPGTPLWIKVVDGYPWVYEFVTKLDDTRIKVRCRTHVGFFSYGQVYIIDTTKPSKTIWYKDLSSEVTDEDWMSAGGLKTRRNTKKRKMDALVDKAMSGEAIARPSKEKKKRGRPAGSKNKSEKLEGSVFEVKRGRGRPKGSKNKPKV